jgi:DNA (cytosine-5)-methyltransferase 3A
MEKINVLSLFNGMNCGYLALHNLGVKVNKYYSSEIDTHAIKVAQTLFPDTIQLGDVTKWIEWDIEWDKIDILIGGSPCQGFSFAGKQLAFDDPRSALFFVFAEIWEHIKKVNPKAYFLLENVRMKEEHENVISNYMDVKPILINSALLSAQNRNRLYWTNLSNEPYGLFGYNHCTIPQPKDKGILLKDVLEKQVDAKYYIKNPKFDFKGMDLNQKARTLRVGGGSSQDEKHNFDLIKIDKKGNIKENQNKASCFTAGGNSGGNHSDMDLIVVTHSTQPRTGKGKGGKGHLFKTDQKSYCLDTTNSQAVELKSSIRRLTPKECMRLQTIPEWAIEKMLNCGVSDTQLYRMLGNGWTVDVISYILNYMKWKR